MRAVRATVVVVFGATVVVLLGATVVEKGVLVLGATAVEVAAEAVVVVPPQSTVLPIWSLCM